MSRATTPEQPDLAAIRARQQNIADVVQYPSFRLMSDEWATISADLNALLNMAEAQARPAIASDASIWAGDMSFRERVALALHDACQPDDTGYTLSERMASVHGGPQDSSYMDAADMILATGHFGGGVDVFRHGRRADDQRPSGVRGAPGGSMSKQPRRCSGRFWTGPHRGENCYHPATRHAHTPTENLYLCGYHARAYTQVWLLAQLEPQP